MNITKPRWVAPLVCEVAGTTAHEFRNYRCAFGLKIGKLAPTGRRWWKFSAVDTAELTAAEALRASGLRAAESFDLAHKLRPALHEALAARLDHGHSVADIEIPGNGMMKRTLNIDAIAGRVIAKLGLTRRGGASVKQREVEHATQ